VIEIFWLEQTAIDVPADDDWLAESEFKHLASLRFPKRRDDWRLGRWTAKRTVAAFLGLAPGADVLKGIEIRAAASGAPEVFMGERTASVSISLSHRSGTGLCVISPANLSPGCDLETVERRALNFLEDYFTAAEQELVARAGAGERDRLITLFWSAKESVLKSLRIGLRGATKEISVEPVRPQSRRLWGEFRASTVEGRTFTGWWREEGGLVRTLAVAESESASG
jgi:4'-phosphopantetheinyl transferase